jgi:hypothetical protein
MTIHHPWHEMPMSPSERDEFRRLMSVWSQAAGIAKELARLQVVQFLLVKLAWNREREQRYD